MSQIIFLEPGKRFGKWTVIKENGFNKNNHSMFQCKCDCGKLDIIAGYALRKYYTRACKDCDKKGNKVSQIIFLEPGARFGKWKIVKENGVDKNNHALFLCECDCGKFGIVRGSALRKCYSRSCPDCVDKVKKKKVRQPCAPYDSILLGHKNYECRYESHKVDGICP